MKNLNSRKKGSGSASVGTGFLYVTMYALMVLSVLSVCPKSASSPLGLTIRLGVVAVVMPGSLMCVAHHGILEKYSMSRLLELIFPCH